VTATVDLLTIQNAASTGNGGAIYNSGTLTVSNSTFSGNSATFGGGIFNANALALTLTNTIVDNTLDGGDLAGSFSGNNNLIDDASISQLTGSDNLNLPALLGPLGDYGGPTQTFPLLPGSPAIDAGDDDTCATTTGDAPVNNLDQRGASRLTAGHCDIGAFESQGFTLTPATGSTPQSANVNTAFANPLAVTVTAINPDEPVDGGMVSYTTDPALVVGATLSAATATIASGQASVTATANDTPGSYSVTVRASSASPVNFGLINSPSSDTTPPATTATATIGGSTPYSFGTWTN
jgi:hypothetical protein